MMFKEVLKQCYKGYVRNRLLLLFLISLLILSGCSVNNGAGGNGAEADVSVKEAVLAASVAESVNEIAENTWYFIVDGISMAPDADVLPVISALGEPAGYFEEESCAAQGTAKLYSYADFEIYTWPDNGTDRIQYIYLKTDRVATAEGVDLSMNMERVLDVYGNPEVKNGRVMYSRGDSTLLFTAEDNGELKTIVYRSKVMQDD